jgi:magnesium-transporting ATPase (P-type)
MLVEAERLHDDATISDETELVFLGFAVFVDPPKPDAAAAVRDDRIPCSWR